MYVCMYVCIYIYIYIYICGAYQQQQPIVITRCFMGFTHKTLCNDNWLLLLISSTNIFALFVTLSTFRESVDHVTLV